MKLKIYPFQKVLNPCFTIEIKNKDPRVVYLKKCVVSPLTRYCVICSVRTTVSSTQQTSIRPIINKTHAHI